MIQLMLPTAILTPNLDFRGHLQMLAMTSLIHAHHITCYIAYAAISLQVQAKLNTVTCESETILDIVRPAQDFGQRGVCCFGLVHSWFCSWSADTFLHFRISAHKTIKASSPLFLCLIVCGFIILMVGGFQLIDQNPTDLSGEFKRFSC
jgi:hypothetical protein